MFCIYKTQDDEATKFARITDLPCFVSRVVYPSSTYSDELQLAVLDSNQIYQYKADDKTWTLIGSEFDAPIVQIACGFKHSLCVTSSGLLYGFESNHNCQLGSSDTDLRCSTYKHVTSPLLQDVILIRTGGYHTIAMTKEHKLVGFGWNSDAQCGNQQPSNGPPAPTLPDLNFLTFDCGYCFTVAVTSDYQGDNHSGQLALNQTDNHLGPLKVSIEPIYDVCCTYSTTIFVALSGAIYLSGKYFDSNDNTYVPVQITGFPTPTRFSMATGLEHAVVFSEFQQTAYYITRKNNEKNFAKAIELGSIDANYCLQCRALRHGVYVTFGPDAKRIFKSQSHSVYNSALGFYNVRFQFY